MAHELAFPCPIESRSNWFAFSPSGMAEGLSDAAYREQHSALMRCTVGEQTVEGVSLLPTPHWHRVTLATQLMSFRNPDGSARDAVVQAHLRWKTASAMDIYARYTPRVYAAEVEEAQDVDTHGTATRLPVLEPSEVHASMQESESLLEAETRAHKRSGEPAAAEPPAKRATREPARAAQAEVAAPAPAPAAARLQPFEVGRKDPVMASVSHARAGTRVTIANSAWEIGAKGATDCTVVAYSSGSRVYVVRADDDGHHYAFTPKALGRYL